MTLHRNVVGASNPLPTPLSYLQKDLPSPPPRYVDLYGDRLRNKKSLGRNRQIKRSATVSELPILSKSTTIVRKYDYAPVTTVTITRFTPPKRTDVPLRRRARSSPALSLDKPLPAMPTVVEDPTMLDTSSIESRETVSTAPTSVHNSSPSLLDPPAMESCELTDHFFGDISTNNIPPTKAVLETAANLPVLDANGKSMQFKNLYRTRSSDEDTQGKRVMIIFIRHFFCGNCQEYIRHLSEIAPPHSLPARTSIVIIGCGSPTMIPMYRSQTSCPYPIYADPTKRLYNVLGMTKTLSLGSKDPAYIQQSLWTGALKSVVQGLSRIPKGDVMKAGDMRQVGGEFLFDVQRGKNVSVKWCHRMRNTRDHAELTTMREVMFKSGEEGRKQQQRLQKSEQPSSIPQTTPANDSERPSKPTRRSTFATTIKRTLSTSKRNSLVLDNRRSHIHQRSSSMNMLKIRERSTSRNRYRNSSRSPPRSRTTTMTLPVQEAKEQGNDVRKDTKKAEGDVVDGGASAGATTKRTSIQALPQIQ